MSDTNQYDIEAPQGISVDPRIIPAFQKFYSYADDPTAHEQFANSWTPDGSYISGSIKAHGRDRVLELRRFSHEKTPIKKRFHYPQKLFVHGDNNLDTMLYGHMRFLLKDGAELEIEWGARALFEEHEGVHLFPAPHPTGRAVANVQYWFKDLQPILSRATDSFK